MRTYWRRQLYPWPPAVEPPPHETTCHQCNKHKLHSKSLTYWRRQLYPWPTVVLPLLHEIPGNLIIDQCNLINYCGSQNIIKTPDLLFTNCCCTITIWNNMINATWSITRGASIGSVVWNFTTAGCLGSASYSPSHGLKGTVSRDFWPSVFFANRLHQGPWIIPENIFEFCFKLAEQFDLKLFQKIFVRYW
jgi:hypothetical protein